MDEAPTHRHDPRPIGEILVGPGPGPATVPEATPVPIRRDASVTAQLPRRRQPPSTARVMLWISIGVSIGMLAMLAMLRA